jgi:hypothetical protein
LCNLFTLRTVMAIVLRQEKRKFFIVKPHVIYEDVPDQLFVVIIVQDLPLVIDWRYLHTLSIEIETAITTDVFAALVDIFEFHGRVQLAHIGGAHVFRCILAGIASAGAHTAHVEDN